MRLSRTTTYLAALGVNGTLALPCYVLFDLAVETFALLKVGTPKRPPKCNLHHTTGRGMTIMPDSNRDAGVVMHGPPVLGLHRLRHHRHGELQSSAVVLLLTVLLIAIWAIGAGS